MKKRGRKNVEQFRRPFSDPSFCFGYRWEKISNVPLTFNQYCDHVIQRPDGVTELQCKEPFYKVLSNGCQMTIPTILFLMMISS